MFAEAGCMVAGSMNDRAGEQLGQVFNSISTERQEMQGHHFLVVQFWKDAAIEFSLVGIEHVVKVSVWGQSQADVFSQWI